MQSPLGPSDPRQKETLLFVRKPVEEILAQPARKTVKMQHERFGKTIGVGVCYGIQGSAAWRSYDDAARKHAPVSIQLVCGTQ